MASLVVLADDGARWRSNHFGYKLFGSTMRFDFAVAKLLDYAESDLAKSDNPFAIVTLAHQHTARTRGHVEVRSAAKWRLTKLLFQRDWNKERIQDLYCVIDWMMALPPEHERAFWDCVAMFAKENNMAWISTGERIGREDGMKEGLKIGREQGREEGRRQAIMDVMTTLLQDRFGPLPAAAQLRLNAATVDQLSAWIKVSVKAQTLEDVFR